MIRRFNCYTQPKQYINYKYRYELLINSIKALDYSVELNNRFYIRVDSKRVIDETFQFDGYVECLFDLGFMSESAIEKFWNFTKQIRDNANEILLYLDNTI